MKAITLTGTLKRGGLQIGGESTGWVLHTDTPDEIEVDVSVVMAEAAVLNGKLVTMAGCFFIEGGEMGYAEEAVEQSRARLAFVAYFLLAILSLLVPVGAVAQGSDWRSVLEGEKAKNAQRLAAIEQEGAPIAAELRKVNAAVLRHNANRCEYPEGQPEVCAEYENEREQLDGETQRLRSQLIPLVEEQDRLRARNKEIERRLNCVQLPTACSSDSDCKCSQSCAAFADGRRSDSGICQPSP